MREYNNRFYWSIWVAVLVFGVSSAEISKAQNVEVLSLQDTALIAQARASVQSAVTGKAIPARTATEITSLPAQGVFVTIERDGTVIGCRGTLRPRFATLTEEVTAAARSAATMDPRYRPLAPADLSRFKVTVTLIERMDGISREQALTLTPAEGLALEANGKTGVVLPWEGRVAATRLNWAYKKAGVPQDAPCRLWRIVARRFRG